MFREMCLQSLRVTFVIHISDQNRRSGNIPRMNFLLLFTIFFHLLWFLHILILLTFLGFLLIFFIHWLFNFTHLRGGSLSSKKKVFEWVVNVVALDVMYVIKKENDVRVSLKLLRSSSVHTRKKYSHIRRPLLHIFIFFSSCIYIYKYKKYGRVSNLITNRYCISKSSSKYSETNFQSVFIFVDNYDEKRKSSQDSLCSI